MMEDHRTRRTFLRSAAIGLGVVGFAGPVQGRSDRSRKTGGGAKGGTVPLVDGPAEFRVYVGTNDDTPADPDEANDFGYPNGPRLASEDPVGGLFDASDIVRTPNGQTLHHALQFFQGFLIQKDRGKPYVLVHDGDGRFTERGQHLNFEARSTAQLKRLMAQTGLDPSLADREPLATLAGDTWRAVGNDIVQFLGEPSRSRRIFWSVTRIDFYRRGGRSPTYELSALYVISPNLDAEGNPTPANPTDPTLRPIPPGARQAGHTLLTAGRSNRGGQ